jgi:hypothetical protein
MGGEYLMYKFYKIDLSLYNDLQVAINQVLYDKYIATQIADCVISPTPQIINNNYVYLILRDSIYIDELIESYINQLTEITEEEFNENCV